MCTVESETLTADEIYAARARNLVTSFGGSGSFTARFSQPDVTRPERVVQVFALTAPRRPIDRVHVGEGGYIWGPAFEHHVGPEKSANSVANRVKYTINHRGQ